MFHPDKPRVLVFLPLNTIFQTHLDLSNSKKIAPTTWIAYNKCEEMRQLEIDDHKIIIGAALSLTEVRDALETSSKVKLLGALIWLLDEYSSNHVRNVAVSKNSQKEIVHNRRRRSTPTSKRADPQNFIGSPYFSVGNFFRKVHKGGILMIFSMTLKISF